MKIVNNKIVECTRMELINYWLTRGFDDIMSYYDYEERMIDAGVKILKNNK